MQMMAKTKNKKEVEVLDEPEINRPDNFFGDIDDVFRVCVGALAAGCTQTPRITENDFGSTTTTTTTAAHQWQLEIEEAQLFVPVPPADCVACVSENPRLEKAEAKRRDVSQAEAIKRTVTRNIQPSVDMSNTLVCWMAFLALHLKGKRANKELDTSSSSSSSSSCSP
ncbi:hypothetical protein DAPPUDRAFT_116480 [Daphnia pulex]|uniref:Uncharacterized protein n=1 Tax=Daphnia pulex TaxID=6669 RepID=E9HPI6_DAPPU|nr:hypothetical protein DAPPUDRAFT_116480 [Daphnia pulex]|eukprot:EFX66345.1 hypothetical protein DAPPUDRAFT_116480 [Daphnia pulex]